MLEFWNWQESHNNVGGEEFLYAGEASGFAKVLEDARGLDEVNPQEVLESEED